MTILYIAFSCSPYHGSEDKIGWNIPLESAKQNRVFVITKTEQRQYIERYLRDNPNVNIQFYYVDIPGFYKKLFSGVLYSGRINVWNRFAFQRAKDICGREKIEIIHQITPVEFRSIGNYGKIQNVKFVCGPLGGGEYIPKGLKRYAMRNCHVELARYIANCWSRMVYKVTNSLCDCTILFANHETKRFLKSIKPDCYRVSSEIGISENEFAEQKKNRQADALRILLVGRFVYRKGHAFLLDALERIPAEYAYECWAVGAGKARKKIESRCKVNEILAKHVTLYDELPYEEVMSMYASADVCVVPSIRETTGTIILEAMAHGVPVITINRFGGATILDEDTGWLYDGTTKEEYIENLKNAIMECIDNPDEVKRKGENAKMRAREYTWGEKMKQYQAIYNSLVQTDY